MSLTDTSKDARQISKPKRDGTIVIERPISVEETPTESDVSVELTGYSNQFGGQLVDRDYEVSKTNINGDGNLEITISTTEGLQGGDYVVEFSFESQDGGTVDVAKFFHQNGVFDASSVGNLTRRVSAELERLSGTFGDGRQVENATDFANLGGDFIEMSNLEYNTTSSGFRKHGGEPIPNFEGSGSIDFSEPPLSTRESTLIFVLQWDQQFNKNTTVSEFKQGNQIFSKIRNEQEYIVTESGYSSEVLYESSENSSNVALFSFRIDTEEATVSSSVNGEITKLPQPLNGNPFESESVEITLNPEGELDDVRLFDTLIYDSYLSDQELRKVSKQLSYLYGIDLTSPRKEDVGQGSSKIHNHMFFNEDILKYDLLPVDSPTISYDITTEPPIKEYSFDSSSTAVAFNSRQRAAIGAESGDVSLLTPDGDKIWTFEGHGADGAISAIINGLEMGRQQGVYSASSDGTLRKIGKRGDEVWNYNNIDDGFSFEDVALYRDVAIYGAGSDGTVHRIIENDGSQDWVYQWIEETRSPEVLSVALDKDEKIFATARNGEFVRLSDSGDEIFNRVPFQNEQDGTFTAINDLAVDEDFVYLVSGPYIKKVDKAGNVQWTSEPVQIDGAEITFESIENHPNDKLYASGGLSDEFKIYEIQKQSGAVSELLFGVEEGAIKFENDISDLAIQPGTYEPHWRS